MQAPVYKTQNYYLTAQIKDLVICAEDFNFNFFIWEDWYNFTSSCSI